MILRSLILLGWEKTDAAGPNPVVNLYTGLDGLELAKAHEDAQKTGKYLAFRKINNPSGIPMPPISDPAPAAPVFQTPEIEPFESDVAKRIEKADEEDKAATAEKKARSKKITNQPINQK